MRILSSFTVRAIAATAGAAALVLTLASVTGANTVKPMHKAFDVAANDHMRCYACSVL